MKILKPQITIKPQVQTSLPTVGDATLVDDTVALVDDTTALVGGPSVTYSAMRLTTTTAVPRPIIKTRR